MEAIVQIGATVVCGFLFEQLLKVMGQRELGNIIKIVALVLAAACVLSAVADAITWVGEKVEAIREFFEPFRNFIKRRA